jgi:hypothetical protein
MIMTTAQAAFGERLRDIAPTLEAVFVRRPKLIMTFRRLMGWLDASDAQTWAAIQKLTADGKLTSVTAGVHKVHPRMQPQPRSLVVMAPGREAEWEAWLTRVRDAWKDDRAPALYVDIVQRVCGDKTATEDRETVYSAMAHLWGEGELIENPAGYFALTPASAA